MATQNKFQTYCQTLISFLSDQVKENFAKLSDDVSRVKYMYDIVKNANVELSEHIEKTIERANELKVSGNKLFKFKKFTDAVCIYNEALIHCPQNILDGKQLHDILIANRSAAFFELKEYDKVVKDIELLQVYGHHPTPHKIYIRAGKACEALNKHTDAINYYKKALSLLKNKNDAECSKEEQKQIIDVENKLNTIKSDSNQDVNNNTIIGDALKLESINMTYPALSSKLKVKSTPEFGRFVVAKEDIKAGETLAVEEPYVCVVYKDTFRTNCAACMRSTNQPIVCAHCLQACFCCIACMHHANLFHKTECKLLVTLFDNDVSLNCLMALRMITQQSLDDVLSEAQHLDKDRNIVIYKTNDYYNVHKLVTHSNIRPQVEFLHYTLMSIYLLRLLKTTDYFGCDCDDKVLTEHEAFIGSLILKHLQILQFNSHEIGELQHNYDFSSNNNKFVTNTVGAGLYPTLALFNHSCDPSLIRFNIGNVMISKAIKHVKRNEIVYENYGYLFTNDEREYRLEKLKELYWFDCNCKPCLEYWPLFKHINEKVLRVACDCGEVLLVENDIEVPVMVCSKCKNAKNIFPILANLIPINEKLNNVNALYSMAMYKEAAPLIIDILEIFGKYLLPPFPDMIKLQQKLKYCMLHGGNKKFDYNI